MAVSAIRFGHTVLSVRSGADWQISGTINPDAKGLYFSAGTYNGKPAWSLKNGTWFLWWLPPTSAYLLSQAKGVTGPAGWSTHSDPPIGVLLPYAGATGNAIVGIAQ